MSDIEKGEILMISLDNRDWTFPLDRWHLPYMDMTYLITGEMWYVYNEQEVHLQGGDMILFPQGSYRQRKKTEIPVRYCSINIRYGDNGFTPAVAGPQLGAVTPQAVRVLEILTDTWHTHSSYKENQCMSLLSFLYSHLLATVLDEKKPYVTEIKGYVSQNLSQKLTLATIANAVHLSPEYCCSLFRKSTNQSLTAYITEQRMDMAKRFMRIGGFTLPEIASSVGYMDYNYFSRVFRKHTGMTPMEYRRSCEKNYT